MSPEAVMIAAVAAEERSGWEEAAEYEMEVEIESEVESE
jgi:hypothetical protein